MKDANDVAEQMSLGKMFQATGPATLNAFPSILSWREEHEAQSQQLRAEYSRRRPSMTLTAGQVCTSLIDIEEL